MPGIEQRVPAIGLSSKEVQARLADGTLTPETYPLIPVRRATSHPEPAA